MKVNFVKTFIPVKDFVAEEKVGNKILVRFDAVENKETGAYSCVEGSVSAAEYDEKELKKEYEAWKQKRAERALKLAKQAKIAEITAYDKSDAVNTFLLNDKKRWLDVNLRRSLSYSTNILKEDGEKAVDIWFDTECETMNIDNALCMLKTLEVYAKQTNNVTHQHKAEVMALTSIEEVESYDITKGYPDKLVFSNEKFSETVSNL